MKTKIKKQINDSGGDFELAIQEDLEHQNENENLDEVDYDETENYYDEN